MPDQDVSFRQLLNPITPEVFFADYYGKQAVHIPGPADKFADIFSWDVLNRLLDMGMLWSSDTMKMALDGRNLEPGEFCRRGTTREGHSALTPDQRLVTEWLREGATLVLDVMEMLTPGTAAVANCLDVVTGAVTSSNLYCSWQQHQGFQSHFDTMDVFALHFEGAKTWHVYEGRFEHPSEEPGFNYRNFTQEHHDQAKGRLLQTVEMTAGDLLYLPKGQYHDALASSEASLHISFGISAPTGQDFLEIMLRQLPEDPLFRENLPHFDDAEAHRAHIRKLGDRLREILHRPEPSAEMRRYQRGRAYERLPGYALPGRERIPLYRVHGPGAKLARRGNGWLLKTRDTEERLNAETAEIAEWVLACDFFRADRLAAAFEDRGAATLDAAIETLIKAHLIERL
jgi:ribosomal protein L16 Arg81 hydroxylase